MTDRRYAQNTKVPVSRSEQEVRRILRNAGADSLVFAEDSKLGVSVVQFSIEERIVRLNVFSPKDGDERELRRRWRALVLILKAKLEIIASGDSTVDREFLADILLPGGVVVGDKAIPRIEESYRTGEAPRFLLPEGS